MNTPHFRNTLIALGVVAAMGAGTGALAQSTTTVSAMPSTTGVQTTVISMESRDGVQPAHTRLSSDLIGATVKHPGEQNETATLRQLLVDDKGTVSHVILGYGGTLGIGEKEFIVPFSVLTFTEVDDELTIHTPLTLVAVQAMPEFRTRVEANDDAQTAATNRVTGTTTEATKSVGESLTEATESAGAAIGEATSETQRVTSDTWITTKVKSSIYADSISQGFEVGVTTLHGAVVLEGNLSNQQAIDHVASIAQSVEGVKSVDVSGLRIQ